METIFGLISSIIMFTYCMVELFSKDGRITKAIKSDIEKHERVIPKNYIIKGQTVPLQMPSLTKDLFGNYLYPHNTQESYKNCRNCGAPVYNHKCDYCNTEQ